MTWPPDVGLLRKTVADRPQREAVGTQTDLDGGGLFRNGVQRRLSDGFGLNRRLGLSGGRRLAQGRFGRRRFRRAEIHT